ncbi:hypothetical protein K7432_012640 [Basidiobolus ranarum]|uniref:TTI1 N-terminal TPR domain-containing protein n=1 Tax=Basidiobolus ranarum TaxID=34480 RepID=A0ABR2WKK5_9FUNG
MQVSSELEERRQHVFRQVKPCCVSLLEWLPDPSPSSQNDLILKLDALLQCLNTIENPQTILHESLLQYISFPLLQTFTKGCLNSDKAITLVLDCLGYLVDNCFQNMGLELQVRIFLIILEFLSEKNETQSKTLGITNVISEELKLQSAKMQAPFFFNKSGRKQSGNTSAFSGFFLCTEQEFSQRRIQLIVARSVHTFVYCIKTEKLLDLRLAVLRNFNQLISDLQNTQILAQFFPGIVTGLSSIVMDNVDRGHSRLLASLLSALEKAIVGTLNDDVNSAYITRITSLNQLDGYFNSKVEAIENTTEYTPESKPDENIESFRKNSSWITAALTQTKALLIKVLRIRSHLDWKVRNACLKLCFNTISHCHKLLNSCFSILIETLVLGLKDTYPEVVTTAKEYLEILLHDPELARHDELVKYNALSLCAVYLQLINQDIDEFLSTNFNDFVSSLILSLELDDSDIQLLETRVIGAYDVRNNPESTSQIDAWSWIPNFKSISEDRTLNQLSLMFRTFGYYGNIVSMMDKLSSHLRSSKGTKDEVVYVFIINELLKGASEHINNDVDSDLQFQNLSINTIYTPRDDDLEHKDRVKITKSIAKVVLREYLSRWNDDTVESNPHYSQPSNKTTSEDNSSLFDPKSTRTSSITQGTPVSLESWVATSAWNF